MITIRRPVHIKLIITEASKARLIEDCREKMRRLKLEMEQLQFQGKKLMTEAQKRGNETLKMVQERIGQEHRQRREKLEALETHYSQLQELPIGSEIHEGTIETDYTVKVGDDWDKIMKGIEIVIKDSIVVEIRSSEGGELR